MHMDKIKFLTYFFINILNYESDIGYECCSIHIKFLNVLKEVCYAHQGLQNTVKTVIL